jgi:hypothetical protein
MVKVVTPVVLALCALTATVGALGIVSPTRLAELIVLIQEPAGLYVAAGFRLLFGGALLGVASGSRAPLTLTIIGWMLIFAGIMMPLVGVEYMREIVRWWLALDPGFSRIWGVVTVMLGGLLGYAVVPRTPDA